MSPKSMVWVSVLTLLISIATLVMVWQMQRNLAHTDADAALDVGTTSLTLSDRETKCRERGGTWTETINGDGSSSGECKRGTLIEKYDSEGRPVFN